METPEQQPALPLRPHTILGVCEAIGEDFGFNPVFLRVPFAATVLLSPTYSLGAYLALGLVVLLSRLLFPTRKTSANGQEIVGGQPNAVANDKAASEELAIAA